MSVLTFNRGILHATVVYVSIHLMQSVNSCQQLEGNALYKLSTTTTTTTLSDRYRIRTDTGRIVSNHIGYFCIGRYIAAGSAAVYRLHYTGDQGAVMTCHPLRANAIDRPRYRSSNAHCNTAAVN